MRTSEPPGCLVPATLIDAAQGARAMEKFSIAFGGCQRLDAPRAAHATAGPGGDSAASAPAGSPDRPAGQPVAPLSVAVDPEPSPPSAAVEPPATPDPVRDSSSREPKPSTGPARQAVGYVPPKAGGPLPRLDWQAALALDPVIVAAAERHDIDPLLLHAVAHVESRHRADANSPAGARGLMQVMPATGDRFGVGSDAGLRSPVTNVAAAAAYLKTLQAEFDGDLSLVLAAYNAGEGAVRRYGNRIPPYRETQAYVRQVLDIYAGLSRARRAGKTGVPA